MQIERFHIARTLGFAIVNRAVSHSENARGLHLNFFSFPKDQTRAIDGSKYEIMLCLKHRYHDSFFTN